MTTVSCRPPMREVWQTLQKHGVDLGHDFPADPIDAAAFAGRLSIDEHTVPARVPGLSLSLSGSQKGFRSSSEDAERGTLYASGLQLRKMASVLEDNSQDLTCDEQDGARALHTLAGLGASFRLRTEATRMEVGFIGGFRQANEDLNLPAGKAGEAVALLYLVEKERSAPSQSKLFAMPQDPRQSRPPYIFQFVINGKPYPVTRLSELVAVGHDLPTPPVEAASPVSHGATP